jgi:hypothetical protein
MTSYLATIPELTLQGVFERGLPNKEHVVLKAEVPVDLGFYAVVLGLRNPGTEALATPLVDSTYWLGSAEIPAGDWVFLFTGPGTPSKIRSKDNTCDLHLIFWNRKQTIFHDTRIIPLLWRLNGITIEKSAEPPPVAPTKPGALTISNLFANYKP